MLIHKPKIPATFCDMVLKMSVLFLGLEINLSSLLEETKFYIEMRKPICYKPLHLMRN